MNTEITARYPIQVHRLLQIFLKSIIATPERPKPTNRAIKRHLKQERKDVQRYRGPHYLPLRQGSGQLIPKTPEKPSPFDEFKK